MPLIEGAFRRAQEKANHAVAVFEATHLSYTVEERQAVYDRALLAAYHSDQSVRMVLDSIVPEICRMVDAGGSSLGDIADEIVQAIGAEVSK